MKLRRFKIEYIRQRSHVKWYEDKTVKAWWYRRRDKRKSIARKKGDKVSVLEKNYQKMSNSAGVKVSGTSFEQISKQIASVSLKKSQVEQMKLRMQ